jgi:hypothetical protein
MTKDWPVNHHLFGIASVELGQLTLPLVVAFPICNRTESVALEDVSETVSSATISKDRQHMSANATPQIRRGHPLDAWVNSILAGTDDDLPRHIFWRQLDRPDSWFRERRHTRGPLPYAAPLGSRLSQQTGSSKNTPYFFRPTANTLCAERTYITPSESAGVAINNSPIEFVPRNSNLRPAAITSMSPSSFDK